MYFRKGCVFAFALSLLLVSNRAGAQHSYTFYSDDTQLKVLSLSDYQRKFGNDPNIPRTDKEIISLAKRLFPPPGQAGIVPQRMEDAEDECGTSGLDRLYAALQNPAITDETRVAVDTIIAASTPDLPKKMSIGHFILFYNDDSASPDYASARDVEQTARALNRCWDAYATYFREPKHFTIGDEKMIVVKVYQLPGLTPGRTNSSWKRIELDNMLTVSNACTRRTTSAHELFHRVQYSYGYAGGQNLRWIVEGTAVWAEKFTYNPLKRYLDWMNAALREPDVDLIGGRAYDACSFWVHLQERRGSKAIREVWEAFEANAGDAKIAVETVLLNRLNKTFDQFAVEWHKTNYIKDLDNATRVYDYVDDAMTEPVIACEVRHGPLEHVPRTRKRIADNRTSFVISNQVKPYGADYYEFPLGNAVTDLRIKVDGDDSGDFFYYLQGIKNNEGIQNYQSSKTAINYRKTLARGEWDKVALIVMGMSAGGAYTVSVRENDLSRYKIARMGLRSHDYYLVTYPDGSTHAFDQNQDHNWNGSVIGGFTGNTYTATWDIPGWNHYIGSMSITVDLQANKATAFRLTKTIISGDSTDKRVTKESFSGSDIPLVSSSDSKISFYIKGAGTCSHVKNLRRSVVDTEKVGDVTERTETVLQNYDCNAESLIYIDLFPEP